MTPKTRHALSRSGLGRVRSDCAFRCAKPICSRQLRNFKALRRHFQPRLRQAVPHGLNSASTSMRLLQPRIETLQRVAAPFPAASPPERACCRRSPGAGSRVTLVSRAGLVRREAVCSGRSWRTRRGFSNRTTWFLFSLRTNIEHTPALGKKIVRQKTVGQGEAQKGWGGGPNGSKRDRPPIGSVGRCAIECGSCGPSNIVRAAGNYKVCRSGGAEAPPRSRPSAGACGGRDARGKSRSARPPSPRRAQSRA